MEPAEKQEVLHSQFGELDPRLYRIRGGRGDLEITRALRPRGVW